MQTQKSPIGLIFRQLAKEKRLSAEVIGKRLGMTRQNVNYLFKNKSDVTSSELQHWASALEVTPEILEAKWNGQDGKNVEISSSEDLASKIEKVFQEWKAENEFLKDQIKKKDQLIEVLMGKSEGAICDRFILLYLYFFGRLGAK